jgi:hypothetical protein
LPLVAESDSMACEFEHHHATGKSMHAHVFLDGFWRNDLEPQVFVAMDFSEEYNDRFENIFKPAIEGVTFRGETLLAFRVNMDTTGDMIHTRIIDGIAHSQLVLADISKTRRFYNEKGEPQKAHNENVFYEVGMALAARQPSEVVLVREDHKELPFDLNSYPITSFEPDDYSGSIDIIQRTLQHRIDDRDLTKDLRVECREDRSQTLTRKRPSHLEHGRNSGQLGG